MSIRARITTFGAAVVVVVVVAVLLAVRPWASSDDDGTITWWVPDWDQETAQTLIDEFEATNPDYTVEMVVTTWDTMANKIQVALDSGDAPDVITELTSRANKYAREGQLTDVTDWYDDSMPTDDFLASALDAVTLDDAIYGVPFRHDSSGLLYNKTMLAAAGFDGPPQTWDELVTMAKALTTDDAFGFGWPLGNDENTVVRFLEQYLSQGGTITVADDGTTSFDTESVEAGIGTIAASIQDGWATKSSLELDNTGLRDLFTNGKIAMYIGGAYDIAPIQEAGIDVGAALVPGVGGPGTTTADGFSFLVPEAAANVDGAKAFVQFLAQPANEAALTATFPARTSAMDDEKFAEPLYQPFLDQLVDHSVPLPNHQAWSDMTTTIFSAVQSAALGDTTDADAADQIQSEAGRLLGPQD